MATISPSAALAARVKRRVALISLLATAGLLILKLWVAVTTHSMGIQAEAANSGLDLIAAVLSWVSIGVAARPADANHPFGHERFENFSAFLETGLLIVTAVWVLVTAVSSFFAPVSGLDVTTWAFVVMAISMVINAWRSRELARTARQYGSDVLEVDALNYAGDFWSGAAVIVGLGIAWLGQARGWTELLHADAAGAVAVAATMLVLALRLGRRTAGVLLDEAPAALRDELRDRIRSVPGVEAVDDLRLRRSGSRYFMDLRLGMGRTLSLERARQVRDEVAERIHGRLPDADLVVETRPDAPASINIFEQIRAIALRHDASVHNLSVYDVGGGLDVELHFELDENLTLKEAHDQVSAIEREMRLETPRIRQIVSHIEPERRAAAPAAGVADRHAAEIVRGTQMAASRCAGMMDCHDIQVRRSSGHLLLSCHCTFPDSMPVARVHEAVTGFESELRRRWPELARVTIHTEPGSDNRR